MWKMERKGWQKLLDVECDAEPAAKMMERNGAEWIDGSSEEQIEEELSTNFIFDVSLATSPSPRLRKTLPTIRRVQ